MRLANFTLVRYDILDALLSAAVSFIETSPVRNTENVVNTSVCILEQSLKASNWLYI